MTPTVPAKDAWRFMEGMLAEEARAIEIPPKQMSQALLAVGKNSQPAAEEDNEADLIERNRRKAQRFH